ncbi:MAG: SH3 domain-containing protein [Pseudanabaenaceae cyanobacterium]
MRIVADLEAPLNVRTGAGKEFPVVGQLENGTRIVMTQAVKGWIKINSPIEGWVACNRTEPFCLD